jgi:hypothetical protein
MTAGRGRPSRRSRQFGWAVAVWLMSSLALASCDKATDPSRTLDVAAASAAATALAEAIDAFATRFASEAGEYSFETDEKELARRLASEPAEQERMGGAADLYADLAKRSMRSLKDGRKAASQLFESIAVVGPALARKNGSSLSDGMTLRQVVTDLVAERVRHSNFRVIESRADFLRGLGRELSDVASLGIYMQKGEDGRHAARERIQRMAFFVAPPDDLVDDNGNLQLPFPMDERTLGMVANWLHPIPGENSLYEVADDWVEADGGLKDDILNRVEPILFKTGR